MDRLRLRPVRARLYRIAGFTVRMPCIALTAFRSKPLWLLTAFTLLWVTPELAASAMVNVHDNVTASETAVFMRVRTRSGPFAAGGERVWLSISGEPEREILTGGDGFGYWKIIPNKTGLLTVRARTRENESAGLLLVALPKDRLVIIEVENGIGIQQVVGDQGSVVRAALAKIQESYRLLYFTSGMGLSLARAWLQRNRLPDAPVLTGDPEKLTDRIQDMGLDLRAGIGSNVFLETVDGKVEMAFSFEKTDYGKQVTDWKDIQEVLAP